MQAKIASLLKAKNVKGLKDVIKEVVQESASHTTSREALAQIGAGLGDLSADECKDLASFGIDAIKPR